MSIFISRTLAPLLHLCAHGLELPHTCSMDDEAQHRVSVLAESRALIKATIAAAFYTCTHAARDRAAAAKANAPAPR